MSRDAVVLALGLALGLALFLVPGLALAAALLATAATVAAALFNGAPRARADFAALLFTAAAVAAALIGGPCTRGDIAALLVAAVAVAAALVVGGAPCASLAALDLYAEARAVGSAAYARYGRTIAPSGWERALHHLRGRPITCAGRAVRAFRVLAAEPGDPSGELAAWLYHACPEPEPEDWQRCAEGAAPDAAPDAAPGAAPDPPAHALDLYGDGEAALGVAVVVRFCDRGPYPMQRDLAVRHGGREEVVVRAQVVPLGGFGPEALIRAALAAWDGARAPPASTG